MSRFWILGIVMFVAGGMVSIAETLDTAVVSTDKDALVNADGFMDNKLFLERLKEGLVPLHEMGKTVDVAILREQLSRTHCEYAKPIGMAEVPMSPVDLYRRQKTAVMAVGALYKCGKCSKWHADTASGFMVSRDGIMITNYHVVDKEDREAMGVMSYDGTLYSVKAVLAANKAADVAILQLDGSGFDCVELAPSVDVGANIWVISNPNKHFYVFTEGLVSSRVQGYNNEARTDRLMITADFGGGSSGAPVFDAFGRVVGMVSSTQPIQAHATPKESYAQMVFKMCVPSESILALFSGAGDTPVTD